MRLVLSALLLAACSKSAPPEGAPLLDRTRQAVDKVCACGQDLACRERERGVYDQLAGELGTQQVSAAVVDELAKQAERLGQCTKP